MYDLDYFFVYHNLIFPFFIFLINPTSFLHLLPRTRSTSGGKVIGYVCGRKKYLNRTLAINLHFQTFTVGLLVYHCPSRNTLLVE